MDLNRFTEKAQEALLQAQSLAGEYSHGQIEGEHLLLALLRQSDGVVPVILQGLGLQVGMLTQQVESELIRRSKVYGGTAQVGLSRELQHSLDRAVKISQEMRDDFCSTEHLLLALTEDRAGNVARLLQSHGLTKDAILRSLANIRGSQRVTSQNPESTYQALAKYGRGTPDDWLERRLYGGHTYLGIALLVVLFLLLYLPFMLGALWARGGWRKALVLVLLLGEAWLFFGSVFCLNLLSTGETIVTE